MKHPANQGSRLSVLMRSAYWQLYKRLTGRAVDISYHGFKLRCYPKNRSASRALYFSGLPDFREMMFTLQYLRPGDQYIDAGANIGLYTLLALSIIGPQGYVHAFEPNPESADRLQEVLSNNQIDNVSVNRIGLSNTTEEVGFNLTQDSCTAHIETVDSGLIPDARIRVARLDERLPDRRYAMAKLDIEGYEPFAIQGASRWLKLGNPPVLQIEMAGYSKRFGVTTPEFIAELDSFGYFTAVYEPETRTLNPTNRPWEIPVDNVLAVSREHQTLVEKRLAKQINGD
ncbi:MAG: FkbM family methyltransferase [Gammaproteobacteria bacterium]